VFFHLNAQPLPTIIIVDSISVSKKPLSVKKIKTNNLETIYFLSSSMKKTIPMAITNKSRNVFIYKTVDFIVNTIRSIPFIILLVFLIPLTLLLIGKSTGPTGAIVPLTVAAIPLFTRLVDTSLNEIDYGVIESAVASGASLPLIVKEVLIPEAMFGIIQSITLTLINLIAFSAMAGVVGGGGIGDLAIRYGYYRFDNFTMWITVILLIILVQITQYIGNSISKQFKKN